MSASLEISPKDNLKKPRLLYLTSEYPHISHTFIRREILGLEARGYEIHRVAIQSGIASLSTEDELEAERTEQILGGSKWQFIRRVTNGLAIAKLNLFKTVGPILQFARAGFRGSFVQIAYLLEALALLSICRRNSIDHIHVHFGTNPTTVALLTKLLGGPSYSMTVHGPVEFDQPYSQRLGAKCDGAAFVFAITSYCRSQLYRWASMSAWKNIHIIGCSVGDEWFEAAQPITSEARDIVCVGRLDEQKGQLLLIDGFADSLARGCDLTLTIIGDGPFRAAIERRIQERDVADKVCLLGWADAPLIRTRLQAARALVLPSFAEGLPVVIMEAMALSRPVIASRITGIPELVRNGKDGWLITPGDQNALVEALDELAEIPLDRLNEMGQAAQHRVRERHHTSLVVEKIDHVLQQYLVN